MLVPERLILKPSTGEDWAISKALPFAIPSATSKRTMSPNSFKAIKCANVPPICPAPIKVIFFFHFYFIVGIMNSGSDLTPEGHLEVIVFNLV